MPEKSSQADPSAAFGPNQWLVDELYEQYRQDKSSVDEAWWEPVPEGESRRPRARIQVVPERAAALLLCRPLGDEPGEWAVEGVYE